jgi:alpha-beta hydrolase superfamily lysophospholipase
MRTRRRWFLCVLLACIAVAQAISAQSTTQSLPLRGHNQTLYLYGPRTGAPIIVSSGDGGWIHLGPHVAEVLAARGYFVIGFDTRAYLSSFTSGGATLAIADEPGDYRTLAGFALRATGRKPILIGVSEGAGLSLLAATDPKTKSAIAGVIGLGLPDLTELGWRWRDAIIYLTHRVPDEPTFSASTVAAAVAPIPLAAIHSRHDEYVPLTEVQGILSHASEPKRLWIIDASDHRFSDKLPEFDRTLVDAIDWVNRHTPN